MLLLGQHDHLSTVPLRQGDTVEVVLEENASTGYLWTAVEVPDGLTMLEDGVTPPEHVQPGAGGTHWFRFRADRTSSGSLVLELRRPWEREASAVERFEVHISRDGAAGGAARR
jgi:predicted secreted protein